MPSKVPSTTIPGLRLTKQDSLSPFRPNPRLAFAALLLAGFAMSPLLTLTASAQTQPQQPAPTTPQQPDPSSTDSGGPGSDSGPIVVPKKKARKTFLHPRQLPPRLSSRLPKACRPSQSTSTSQKSPST